MENDILLVTEGHYCSNDTMDSEIRDIIRVIGPDKNRAGYWKTQDGNFLHESLIIDSYTKLDTIASTQSPKSNNIKSNIFKGLKPTKNDINETDELAEPYDRDIPEHLLPDNDQKEYSNSQYATPTPQNEDIRSIIGEELQKALGGLKEHTSTKQNIPKNNNKTEPPKEKFKEEKKLIEKASVFNLNKASVKKYGEERYKPTSVNINFEINIPYDLTKLSDICELFEIDYKTVAEILISDDEFVLSDIKKQLFKSIIDELNMPSNNNRNNSEPRRNPKQKENTNIETGIIDVEKFLNTL